MLSDTEIPRAAAPWAQHALDTYASETNKVASVWGTFRTEDLVYRPHERSSTVLDVMKHQLLSERRFFGEFLAVPEPAAADVMPPEVTSSQATPDILVRRLLDLARPRLGYLAARGDGWWLDTVPFFDVHRQRVWIFWRRVLHTAHHRTQLTVYLRLLDRPVPSTYGPTADVTWSGADPTNTVAAAQRRG